MQLRRLSARLSYSVTLDFTLKKNYLLSVFHLQLMAGFVVSKLDVCNVSSNTAVMVSGHQIWLAALFQWLCYFQIMRQQTPPLSGFKVSTCANMCLSCHILQGKRLFQVYSADRGLLHCYIKDNIHTHHNQLWMVWLGQM